MKLAPQSQRTFFISTVTAQRRRIFQSERMARLLMDELRDQREKHRLQLHEFVIMPDHVHLILTPAPGVSLEKAMQFVKGGFSFRAKRDLNYAFEVWERSFSEHRIKEGKDYERYRSYIRENPVHARLAASAEAYDFSSAAGVLSIDSIPPGLKPSFNAAGSQG